MSPQVLHYLSFDLGEDAFGVLTLEAVASTESRQHAAVLQEVQQLLDWAWRHHPDTHGPLDEGGAWHHDLQVCVEEGGWHAVTLTLVARREVVDPLLAAFAIGLD